MPSFDINSLSLYLVKGNTLSISVLAAKDMRHNVFNLLVKSSKERESDTFFQGWDDTNTMYLDMILSFGEVQMLNMYPKYTAFKEAFWLGT